MIDNWTLSELHFAYRRTYKPGSKTALFYKAEMLSYLINIVNVTEPPKLLEDRFILENGAFMFPRNHFLFEAFNRKLQHYIEADLVKFHTRYYDELSNPLRFKKYEEPFAVLKLEELEAGFVVWLLPLLLSFLVFGFEWMSTLKNLAVFLFVFKRYIDVKESEQNSHCNIIKARLFLITCRNILEFRLKNNFDV